MDDPRIKLAKKLFIKKVDCEIEDFVCINSLPFLAQFPQNNWLWRHFWMTLKRKLAKKLLIKKLIVKSNASQVCLFVFGAFYYLKETELTEGMTWLPLVNFIIFVVFFMVRTFYSSIQESILPNSVFLLLLSLIVCSKWKQRWINYQLVKLNSKKRKNYALMKKKKFGT